MSRITKTWINGLALCSRYDMDFVTFDSRSEQDQLTNLLGDEVYFIGITDAEVEGTFKNYNGLEINSGTFMNWSPDNAGNEDCAWISRYETNDYSCEHNARIACERRIPKIAPTEYQKSLAPEPVSNKFDFNFKSGSHHVRVSTKIKFI